jgi:rhamnulokinase
MAGRTFVGIDLGAESGRVMAGVFDGRRVRLDEVHRFPNGPVELAGSLRWDVLRLWAEVRAGLAAAAARHRDVASVGADTWGVDYVLLAKSGEVLGHRFHYRDGRTRGVMERAFETVPRDEVYAATGVQFLPFNTLYQLLAARDRTPDVLAAADRLLLMPDFLHGCLCGSTAIEFTNATTTQLFDPAAGTWAADLLRRLDLPARLLGEVVRPGTVLGEVRPEVLAGPVRVVAPATHDTASAVAAVPAAGTGWAYVSSGTWSLVGVEVPAAVRSPQALAPGPTNEGGVGGTYRLLKNVMGLWLVQRCREAFRRAGDDLDYDALLRRAAAAEPFRSLVEPDDPRFLNPPAMTAAIAGYCRETAQPEPRTPGEFTRCCLESLALKYRLVLGWLAEVTGTPIRVVHVVGGGSRNRLLNQLTADATGLLVLAGPVEATALPCGRADGPRRPQLLDLPRPGGRLPVRLRRGRGRSPVGGDRIDRRLPAVVAAHAGRHAGRPRRPPGRRGAARGLPPGQSFLSIPWTPRNSSNRCGHESAGRTVLFGR